MRRWASRQTHGEEAAPLCPSSGVCHVSQPQPPREQQVPRSLGPWPNAAVPRCTQGALFTRLGEKAACRSVQMVMGGNRKRKVPPSPSMSRPALGSQGQELLRGPRERRVSKFTSGTISSSLSASRLLVHPDDRSERVLRGQKGPMRGAHGEGAACECARAWRQLVTRGCSTWVGDDC